MTPLIGSAPSSGTGSVSTGPATTGPATVGPASIGSDGIDSFASVLAATEPAPTSVAVSTAIHGGSGSAGSASGDQPADPASAAALAASFAVAALALPVPVPVPATPAAASAWSADQPAVGGSGTSVQSAAGASQPIEPARRLGQSPPTTAAPAATTAPTTAAATAEPVTTAAQAATVAAAAQPPASTSAQLPSGTAGTPSTGTSGSASSPAVAPAVVQGFVGGLRTVKPPTQPDTATAGSAQFAAPVASPIAAGADRPAVTPVGGPNVVAVQVANPPVDQRPSTPNKPIAPVVTHDPAGPVLASHPLPRHTNESGTGSNDRERPSNPQPSIIPAASTGFSLTDASQATLAASQPVGASQPVPASQPATAQSASADQLPVSHQLASPVLSLRTAGNGSHQLTIALHPAELGPVNLHVRIVGDSMAIQLASTSEGAHDALREALPQLRQELQAAGLGNVDLSLDLGGAPSGNHAQAGNQAQAGFGQPESGYQTEQPVHTAPRRSTTAESGLDRWL